MTEPFNTNPNRLVEAYISYSHAISADILKKLPSSVDRDDVIGAAELGLVEAARNFDPSRGVLFKTFAYYRIRGAIYDALRKMGWLKGDSKLHFEAGANEYIKDYSEAGAGQAPSPTAAYRELQQLTSSVLTSYLVSIDASDTEIADPNGVSVEDALVEDESRQQVKAALSQLPENNRRLMEEYYFHEATLEEIGGRLGLSKSWVCRLHAKTLDMLRELMSEKLSPISNPTRSSPITSTDMEPISQKAGTAGGVRQAASDGQKSAPSKFDVLRADLSQKLQLPPKVTSIDNQQKALLENDLRRKLDSGKSPQEVFSGDMNKLGSGIADLNRQVAAVPDTSAFAPLRERLKSVEADFNASAKLLKSPGDLSDPQRLLEMQMQMYKLTQNVEIVSRVVGDAASGVKTMLQTQV
jgi:RNA polymerase sigma factor FliA